MRGKYIIITLLVMLLTFVVYKMMLYESTLRQEKTVKLYLEDESKPLLEKLPDEALTEVAANAGYYFTANGDYFKKQVIKYPESGKEIYWENFFLKGVNLGVALPGKYPAEFSLTFSEYLEWLILIGEMNANTIRTYTILPPEFYNAFLFYNLHYNHNPLYLVQGVWAEIPGDHNFYNAAYQRKFKKEIVDMINVIHGNAVLKEQRGKASGVYAADVSEFVAAILLGREWEPESVYETNQVNNIDHYNGDFIYVNDGNAMEAWLASMMDFAVLFETQEYHFQHPVSFVNWLPLDPMYHDTEIIENKKVREYDNDLESIDFAKFHVSELFFPGIYAAYHAYPYYPDFVYLQPSYLHPLKDGQGPNPYYYYLTDLKQHNRGMPLVIAEYGLPSSRGSSHGTPCGFDQGGHSEEEQAELSRELTRDILEAQCAGAIYFEWIDEWFKHNWLVMDFEQPFERRNLWHNMENPEQNFGIYAMESRSKTMDADLSDWDDVRLEPGNITIETSADAGYYYLAAALPGFSFKENNLYIALDTYSEELGDHKLPFVDGDFDNGFEFLLEFKSRDSAFILVDEPYTVYTDIFNDSLPVYASKKNNNGKYIHQMMQTNRKREDLLGNKTPEVIVDRSPLQHGNTSEPPFSNADWFYKDHTMEIRLDWHLINVSDPSHRYVLDDQPGTRAVEYSKTDGFNLLLFITDKDNNLIRQYPGEDPIFSTWEEWQNPVYSDRLKPVYYTFQECYYNLSPVPAEEHPDSRQQVSFELADYFNNKQGAVSISFDNAGFSQFEHALPVLEKYGIKASFGIVPELLDDPPGIYPLEENLMLKRLGLEQVLEIAGNNEIAFQSYHDSLPGREALNSLGRKCNCTLNTIHLDQPDLHNADQPFVLFARRTSENNIIKTDYNGISYFAVDVRPSQVQLDSILAANERNWTIMVYHHLIDQNTEVLSKLSDEEINQYFISRADFEKQVRLIRNRDYWIAPEGDVYRYLREKKESTLRFTQYQNMIFCKIENDLDRDLFNIPLTVNFSSPARIVGIKGSQTDGTYTNRTGIISFNALPNKEITIEIID